MATLRRFNRSILTQYFQNWAVPMWASFRIAILISCYNIPLITSFFMKMLSPKKSARFLSAFTLKRLLNHPRLKLLKQDQSIWAFKIRETPATHPPVQTNWHTFFPTLRWEMERTKAHQAKRTHDPSASGQSFLALTKPKTTAQVRPFKPWGAPNAQLVLRARGHGHIRLENTTRQLSSTNWTWLSFPIQTTLSTNTCTPVFTLEKGQADLDYLYYFSGEWAPPRTGCPDLARCPPSSSMPATLT